MSMQNKENFIEIYKRVIEPKLKHWVIFENGTCVIVYNLKGDLKTEAIEVLKKYGTVSAGTPSADFTVLKVDQGWIVTGDQPGILNYVSEHEGRYLEDYEIGLLGRDKKEQDSKELKTVYINNLHQT